MISTLFIGLKSIIPITLILKIFSGFGQWKVIVGGFYALLTCPHHYLSNFLFSGIRYTRLIIAFPTLAQESAIFPRSPGSLVKNGI